MHDRLPGLKRWRRAAPALLAIAMLLGSSACQPGPARSIVQKKLGYDDAYMATVTPAQHTYSLSLDQSLIIAMEDEGRWMINNGMTAEPNVPDLMAFVHTGTLKKVKPRAVKINE